MRTIICTVGTSLLTNRDSRPWSGWSPRERPALPAAETVDSWLETSDPVVASAEINTLHRLEIGEGDELALLHSATPEGEFCAKRLEAYFEPRLGKASPGHPRVKLQVLGHLGYGAAAFSGGLKSLVDCTLQLVRDARKRERLPVLCATGGFKPEGAFLGLVGALLEIDVVYIHELHRELVFLPRLPLSWDPDFVVRNEDFFLWIDGEPRPSHEVEQRLKACPELRPLIEDGGEGNSYLTAAGNLLFQAAQEMRRSVPHATWPKADPRPPAEKNRVSTVEHHRPDGWEKFVRRLCEIDCVTSVAYEPLAFGGERVKILDEAAGSIGLRYEKQSKTLPLRVESTARGAAQTDLLVTYLRTRR